MMRNRGPLCPPAGLGSEANRPNGQSIRMNRKPAAPAPKAPCGQGPHSGSRGGGPLCPLRWVGIGGKPSHWATQTPESKNPLDPPPKPTVARGQPAGRGGADLCVRSAGPGSEGNRPAGQPNAWIETLLCAPATLSLVAFA